MIKAYRFKIKRPSKVVVQRLEQTLDLCRELYNAALQERRDAWRLNRVSIKYFDQSKQLPDIKSVRDDLKTVYGQVLQDVLRRLDKAFSGFYRRVKIGEKAGFPRFKGKNSFDSFCYPQIGYNLENTRLTLAKIGSMKIHLSRPIIGKIKNCTIKREVDGWYVIFTVETTNTLLPKTGKQIGIDVGIESFATLSDGTQIENHKFSQSLHKKLRAAQRRVSRRKKGSNCRLKAVKQLSKIHLKIKNQRNDFTHKLSTKLVSENDLIAIEKLKINQMVKGLFSKQIHDAAWSSFFHKLKYKAENAGKSVIEVNPNGTSQTCVCGETVRKDLSIRWHHCNLCGLSEHRDIVSAKVILKLGLGQSLKDSTYASR